MNSHRWQSRPCPCDRAVIVHIWTHCTATNCPDKSKNKIIDAGQSEAATMKSHPDKTNNAVINITVTLPRIRTFYIAILLTNLSTNYLHYLLTITSSRGVRDTKHKQATEGKSTEHAREEETEREPRLNKDSGIHDYPAITTRRCTITFHPSDAPTRKSTRRPRHSTGSQLTNLIVNFHLLCLIVGH